MKLIYTRMLSFPFLKVRNITTCIKQFMSPDDSDCKDSFEEGQKYTKRKISFHTQLYTIGFLLLFLFTGIQANAQFTITENFKGSSAAGITIGGDAVLTSGGTDPAGQGWLRLTPAALTKAGFAYINQSFPSTLGVLADFEYKTWRADNPTFGGADGIGVFLFDASVSPFKLGPNGGSLGYTANAAGNGLSGGYIGVGLDEFGNFSSGQGGPGQRPNAVVLRGPTTALLATSNTYRDGANVGAIGYGTLTSTRPTDAQFYRRVQVEITPTGVLNTYSVIVRWTTTPNGTFTQLFQYTLTTAVAVPANLKIGFASSTGGGYNNHEIRNLIVTTPGGVRVMKSVDKTTANVGDVLTYTIDAVNQTPATLTGLNFTDALSQFPPGFQITSVTFNNNGNVLNTATGYSTTNLSNIPVSLGPNATGTFTIVGKINSYPTGGTITNTANFNVGTSGITDPDLTNNTSTVTTTVLQNDLSITKAVDNATPRVNTNVAFTLSVKNNGTIPATGVSVTDQLPSGYSFISSNGTYNSTTGVWTIGNLAAGATTTLTINAKVLGTGSYANTATVTATEYDPTPANNTATNTPVPIAPYDLAMVKTASPTTAVAGQTLVYILKLTNNGPSPILATDIINVTDNLPAGFTASSYTAQNGTYNSSNGNWTGLTLANGASSTIAISGTVSPTATTALSNTATVTTPAGITDPVPGNNTSTITTPMSRVLDLGVTKFSNPTTVVAGQPLTYTITLTNNGPSSLVAADITNVAENLPAGFTATTYTPANGTYTSNNGNWTGLTLASGQSTTLTIAGTTSPSASGTLSNSVTVTTPTGTTDPTPVNNTATTLTGVARQIDFSITKTASPKPAVAGQALTYTLTLKNNGVSSLLASDIVNVTDNLPAGFTATSYTPAAGTYTSSNGNWTGLTLANGQTTTLVIAGTVSANTPAGNLTNTATVNPPTGVTDPTPGNNTGTDVTAVTRVIDLGIAKSATPNPAVTGNTLTYTITLTNNGPSTLAAADVIQVIDNLPAGFTATSYTPASGTYTSSNGNWTGLTLASGQTTTLAITGTVAANATGSLSNTVTVTVPAGITDPTPGNNTATITTPISRVIDLTVAKTAAPKPAIAGQPLTYTITLSNTGPGTLLASDIVTITDNLPAGFTANTFTPAAGSYNSSNGNWTGLTLTNGQSTTLTITGTVAATASGSLTNTVTVTPPTGVTDPTPTTATDVTPINRVIDFGVNKTASPATGIPGETLTYTITLTNNGPSTLAAADILQVTDNLPAGFTATTYAASAGTYTSNNGNWTGLTLASGQSATLTITGKIATTATGSLSNTATVTPPTGVTDPTPGNNTSTITTNLTPKPVLSITKLGAAGLTAGNTATYTLNISNTGSSNAVGATISDIIPATLSNVSWTSTVAGAATITTGGTGTGNNVSLTANIPAGAANTISITITGTVDPGATGTISNTATVTPAEPTGTGSNSTVNANVTSTSGVVITKTGPSTATAGNQVTYQLEISNNG
ncbi:beta strand repeat-containing protein, partial [Pedobacter lusitanus]